MDWQSRTVNPACVRSRRAQASKGLGKKRPAEFKPYYKTHLSENLGMHCRKWPTVKASAEVQMRVENHLWSTRQILALFRKQSWGYCWETGRSAYWPFLSLRCHLELKLKLKPYPDLAALFFHASIVFVRGQRPFGVWLSLLSGLCCFQLLGISLYSLWLLQYDFLNAALPLSSTVYSSFWLHVERSPLEPSE